MNNEDEALGIIVNIVIAIVVVPDIIQFLAVCLNRQLALEVNTRLRKRRISTMFIICFNKKQLNYKQVIHKRDKQARDKGS